MRVLVIPTTDWTRHPVPNRLNFIFDILAQTHEVYVLHFQLQRFKNLKPRPTECRLVPAGFWDAEDPSLYYLINSLAHFQEMRRVVKKENIDVVLSTNILPSFLANFLGVPVVFDYLDHLEESASIYYPNSLLGRMVKMGVGLITRFNLRHAEEVITVTEELKGYLEGVGVERVTVIPNGADTNLLRPGSMTKAKEDLGLVGKVIGYVGSLEHWVDLETVVDAMPDLEATLLIVGPGLFTDYGKMIRERAERLGVLDKVVFTGAVPYPELGRYISAMDVGLNPLKKMKKNEYAAGGKVFNYLSCGRPVLSSRMVSLERLLGGSIYYYDDRESFLREAKRLLTGDQDEGANRAIAEKFDWRALTGDYEAVLKKAVREVQEP